MPKSYIVKYALQRLLIFLIFIVRCILDAFYFILPIAVNRSTVIFDFHDGIYADFYFPIYQELKLRYPKFRLLVSYSSRMKKRDRRFDRKDFIANPVTILFRKRIIIFASIPSSKFHQKSLGKTLKVQVFHGFASMGSAFGKEFIISFDRVFTTARHLKSQLAATEYSEFIAQNQIIEVGYPKIDGDILPTPLQVTPVKRIFYGPTYHHEISSIFTFLPTLLEYSKRQGIELIIKLHPLLLYRHNYKFSGGVDWVKHLKDLQRSNHHLQVVETTAPFSEVRKLFLSSDLFVTDVSGLGYEFCLITGKPVVFLGTKLKIPINDMQSRNIEQYSALPEIRYRGIIGPVIELPENFEQQLKYFETHQKEYLRNISEFREVFTVNVGNASPVAAREIEELAQEF